MTLITNAVLSVAILCTLDITAIAQTESAQRFDYNGRWTGRVVADGQTFPLSLDIVHDELNESNSEIFVARKYENGESKGFIQTSNKKLSSHVLGLSSFPESIKNGIVNKYGSHSKIFTD